MKPSRVAAAAVSFALLSLAACAHGDAGDSQGVGTKGEQTTLRVYAAASLSETFEALGESFETSHEGVEVAFNFAGSSDLVAQILQGAPADVIATADTPNMDKLVEQDALGSDPTDFASNTLQIAVPPGNPAGVTGLTDLADPQLVLVVCSPRVPCGSAAVVAAAAGGITLSPDSEEAAVTDVLGKVSSGEADAGLVYVTDVLRAGDAVVGIPFEESRAAVNTYPIATVAVSTYAELAQEFVALVLGPEGMEILAGAGFGPP